MIKNKIFALGLCFLFLLSTTACNVTSLRSERSVRSESSENMTVLDYPDGIRTYEAQLTQQNIEAFDPYFSNGINTFGFETLHLLYDDENISISPASLQLALLMTATGATGETREEIMRTLNMDILSEDQILDSVRQLMWRTNTHGMENANSLWLQDGYPFSDEYLNVVSGAFMADLFQANFINNPNSATRAINQWASEKTNDRIPEIMSSDLSTDTRLVLVNALFYLGEWVDPFDPFDTYNDVFYGTQSDNRIPFMHDTRYMNYYQDDLFQMISMPFKDDEGNSGPYAMAFILPDENSTIPDVINYFSTIASHDIFSTMQTTRVMLSLPKFEFEYGLSMTEPLQDLGIQRAFSGNAQFDAMTGSDNDLFISNVVHKTYIRVDEEGAEAAAVTAIEIDGMMAPAMEDFVEFNANRPFIFAIYDTTDNTIIFVGVTAQL